MRRHFYVILGILFVALECVTPGVRAELLPPGDVNGKSLDELGLDWIQWGVATGLGGEPLPDTFDGIRYLPPNFGGGDFVFDLTVQQGTPLLVSPFFVIGEQYDNGAEDNPSDPFIDTIFEGTTIRTEFDGVVVLEGAGNEFPERLLDVTVFPAPIPYADPQPRGDVNAISSIFGTGIVTVFGNLAVGEHTIRNEFDSNVFGPGSFTYNVTVVPEPAGLAIAGICALGFMLLRRLRRD